MNQTINLKFASSKGYVDIQANLDDKLRDVKNRMLDILNVKTNLSNIMIRFGFPPKVLQGESSDDKTLRELAISNNEVLKWDYIQEVSKNCSNNIEDKGKVHSDSASNEQTQTNSADPKNDVIDPNKYSVYRQIVPADNSCLFNAINFAINQTMNEPEIMRGLIAVEIQSNPELYNEAVLEKDPADYCDWIMRNDTWGGGIELAILSKCFQVTLGVVDIKHLTIEYFGEV